MLRIDRIKFSNFRQYRDDKKCTVDFAFDRDSQKNVTVIEGTGGFGKTNFLSGILWCLYGDEGKSVGRGLPILNRLTEDELGEGDQADVVVEVYISIDEDKYSITRTARFKRINSSITPIRLGDGLGGTKFEVFAFSQNSQLQDQSPEGFVKTLIPKNVRDYFFFDGEKLEKYFELSAHRKIQEAVFNVSQLDVLDTIIHKSDELLGKLQREINKLPSADKFIGEKITSLGEDIKQLSADVAIFEKNKEELEDRYEKVFSEFENLGGDEAHALVNRKNQIEGELKALAEPIEQKEQAIRRFLASCSAHLISQNALKKANSVFLDAEEVGLIPPSVQADYIDKLLRAGTCICGESIQTPSREPSEEKRRDNIIKIKEKIPEIASHSHEMLESWTGIKNILKGYGSIADNLNYLKDEMRVLVERRKELSEEKEQILAKISDRAVMSGINDLKAKIKSIHLEIQHNDAKIASKKAEIENKNKEKSELDAKQTKLTESDAKSKLLDDKREVLKNLVLIATSIQSKVMDETRTDIALHTKEFFSELMIEDVKEVKLEISKDYELSCEVNVSDMLVSLSKGQQAALAVAFLMALNKFSGFEAPLFFDSVVGRVGKEMRKNFARVIPSALASRQIVFLLLDSEYDEGVRECLSVSTGAYFKIQRPGGEKFVSESIISKQE